MGTLDELGQPGHVTGLQWTRPQAGPAISELASLPSGCENPKPSLTELVVLEHGLYAGDPVSKVLLQPLTGVSRMCAQGPCSLLTMSCLGLSGTRSYSVPHPAGEEPAQEPQHADQARSCSPCNLQSLQPLAPHKVSLVRVLS